MASKLVFIGTAVVLIGLVLHIIGFATPNWTVASNGVAWMGLFQLCSSVYGCSDIEVSSDELNSVIAMTALGLVAGVLASTAAVGITVVMLQNKSVTKMMLLVCQAACVAAFIFIIIGIVVYVVEIYDKTVSGGRFDPCLGYSFALCIVGSILMPIGSGMIFAGGYTHASYSVIG